MLLKVSQIDASWPCEMTIRPGGGAALRAACAIEATVPPSKRLGIDGHPEHDACAVAWVVAPQLFTSRMVFAEVDCGNGPGRGQTLIDRWDRLKRTANVRLLESVDAEGFFQLLGQALTRLA